MYVQMGSHVDHKRHQLLLLPALLRLALLSHDSDGGESGGISTDVERSTEAACLCLLVLRSLPAVPILGLSPLSIPERVNLLSAFLASAQYLLLVPRSAMPHPGFAHSLPLPLFSSYQCDRPPSRSFSRTSPSVTLRRGGEDAVVTEATSPRGVVRERAGLRWKPRSTGLALQGTKNMNPHALGVISSPCASSLPHGGSCACAAAAASSSR